MKQYLELLNDVVTNGLTKGDRTGTGTKAVFAAVTTIWVIVPATPWHASCSRPSVSLNDCSESCG